MKRDDIYQMLLSIGLPVVYYSYPTSFYPDLDYITYSLPTSRTESADSTNSNKITTLNINLYTKKKDFEKEDMIERILTENNIVYIRTESYLSGQSMFEETYEGEFIDG